ncbi:MAG: hypothetical protein ABWY05_07080 [Noviherbaspirillum sp.]
MADSSMGRVRAAIHSLFQPVAEKPVNDNAGASAPKLSTREPVSRNAQMSGASAAQAIVYGAPAAVKAAIDRRDPAALNAALDLY